MKTMKIIFLSCILILSSCKKEKVEPVPQNPSTSTPPVTVSTTVSVSLVDIVAMDSIPLNTLSIELIDADGTLDTTYTPIGYTLEATYPMSGPCGVTSTAPFTFTKTMTEGSYYRMRIYSGLSRILDYKINQTSYSNDTIANGASCSTNCGVGSTNHDFVVIF